MSTLEHTTLTLAFAARGGIVARVVNRVGDLLRALKNRGEVRRLAEMSDRELADIGLTRADLAYAASRPLTEDPTTGLASLAASRSRLEAVARQVC